MESISLNGRWALVGFRPGEGKKRGAHLPELEGRGAGEPKVWPNDSLDVPAEVPGDVHLDLARAGTIEEPLVGLNAKGLRWIEDREWWFRRTFTVPGDRVGRHAELLFEGLDYEADIFLNGERVGRHLNAFVPCRIDVSDRVRPGENLLCVRLECGARQGRARRVKKYLGGWSLASRSCLLRKPQFTFGWDWAPKLLTCGIWRPASLELHEGASIRDVQVRTAIEPVPRESGAEGWGRRAAGADLAFSVEVESFFEVTRPMALRVTVANEEKQVERFEAAVDPGPGRIDGTVHLEKPLLWYPRPMGEQHLYTVVVDLMDGENVLDHRLFKTGLRRVRLLQEPLHSSPEPPERGQTFTLEVNGARVFACGANWVPADSVLARVDGDRYGTLLEAAADAHFNMLRIWGGGIYEDEAFYDLCDAYGILVWQDFMFSCALYPDDDPEFVAQVRGEAEAVVRRLRNHPSLALWCGNNECDMGYRLNWWSGAKAFHGESIYHELLPEVCGRLDPDRPYWPSSPYGDPADPNGPEEGDQHPWEVSISAPTLEERADYRRYERVGGRFVSEYGMLAPPALESLRQGLGDDEAKPGGRVWTFHTNPYAKGVQEARLDLFCGEKAGRLELGRRVLLEQIIQAEGLRTAIEHFRRRKFTCSGSLFWMFNDCWPAVSWSVIDYYGRRKPAYYAVKRAYQPILVSIRDDRTHLSLWVVNDTLEPLEGRLEHGLMNLSSPHDADVLTDPVRVAPNSAAAITTVPVPTSALEWKFYFARLQVKGAYIAQNRFLFTTFKGARWPEVTPYWTLEAVDGLDHTIKVGAACYAWAVRLDLPEGVLPEDNYFDLFPGDEKSVRLKGPAELARKVQVRALNDGGPWPTLERGGAPST